MARVQAPGFRSVDPGARPWTLFDILIDVITAPYDGINWLADRLFLAMSALFERFGVPIVFVSALAEALVGVGVVYPGVLLLFLAGAYTAERGDALPLVFAAAVAGTIIGDTVSYGIGRWGRRWLVRGRLRGPLLMGEELVRGADALADPVLPPAQPEPGGGSVRLRRAAPAAASLAPARLHGRRESRTPSGWGAERRSGGRC